jgi:hypothetical protein
VAALPILLQGEHQVSRLLKHAFFAALGLMLALAPLAPAQAQNVKPVAVLSIASWEKLKADVLYIAELVGQKEKAEPGINLGQIYLSGIDLKRPMGAYVTVSAAGEPRGVAFIPVTKLDTILKNFEGQIGKPSDAGDGVKQFDVPGGSVYVKEVKGWAFVSNEMDVFDSLPADPVALLGKLPAMYDIAIQAKVHDIPQELRQMAVDAIQSGFEQGLEKSAGSDADRELQEKFGRMSTKQFTQMIEEVNEVTIGWGVDKTLKARYFDSTVTAVDGRATARRMALLKDASSGFAGFLLPDSSINLNGSSQISKEDIEQNVTLLELLQQRASKEIDNDAGLETTQRTAAKDLLGQFFAVLTDTVKGGKMDYGAVLTLDETQLNFAGGILVADGKKLETAFAKLVELAKNEPDFPEVKLNAGKHGNVNLHTIAVDLPEEADEGARELFGGDQVLITLGTAPKALYIAFGKEGEAVMKKAIDASATKAQQAVPPSQVNLFLKPIMKFVAAMDKGENSQLQAAAEAFEDAEAGADEISIVTKPIPGGAMGRLQVSEGVLKLIGEAVKAAQDSE